MSGFRIMVDGAKRRVTFVAEGELESAVFRDVMGRWVNGAASQFAFDRLYDLRDYAGTVSNDDVRYIGQMMRAKGANITEGRTVFVSLDRGFSFWARSMQLELPKRPMQVVSNMTAAEALLVAPR